MKSESEEDDEEEEEEDEDDYNRPQPIKMLKPVYVHKHERESQQEKIVQYYLSFAFYICFSMAQLFDFSLVQFFVSFGISFKLFLS